MASTVQVLEARVQAGGVDTFVSQMAAASKATIGFKEAVGVAGAALATAAAGGIVKATQAAIDFESQMAEVAKVTSTSFAGDFQDRLLEMSKRIPLSTEELANLAAQAGQFGVPQDQIEGFVETVAKMAAATDLTADQAGEAFAKIATLTGTPIPQMENLGSSINTLSNNFAASSSEIVDAMLRSSGALSSLGVSTPDIIGLNTALVAVSDSSERAGSRLRRLAQEMVEPKKVGDLARALGMTTAEFKRAVERDPTGVILQMAAAMKEGGASADILNSTLSTTSRQALQGLAANLDQTRKALRLANQSFKEAESLQREFAIQSQTAKNQIQLLKNEITIAAIRTGQVFLPAVAALVGVLKGAVGAFNDVNRATEGYAGAFTLLASLVGGATLALSAFVGGPIVAVPALLAAAGAAAVAFKKAYDSNFADVKDATDEIVHEIGTQLTATFATLRAVALPIIADLRRAWAQHRTDVESSIRDIVMAVAGTLGPAIRTAGDTVRTALMAIGVYYQTHGDQIADTIETAYAFVRDVISQRLADIELAVTGTTQRLTDAWSKHGDDVTTAIDSVTSKFTPYQLAVASLLPTLVGLAGHSDTLRKAAGSLAKVLGGSLLSVVSRLAAPIVGVASAIGSSLLGSLTGLLGPAASAVTSIGGVGSAIGLLTNPITIAVGAIVGLYLAWKTNFLNIRQVTDQTLKALGSLIRGDFDGFKQHIGQAGKDLVAGWDRDVRPLIEKTSAILDGVGQAFKNGLDWIWTNAVQPVIRSIEGLWNTHRGHVTEDVNQLMTALTGAFNRLKSVILPIVRTFIKLVMAAWNKWGDEILAVAKFAFDTVGSVIGAALDVLFTAIDVFTDILVGDWDGAFQAIKALTSRLLNGVVNFIKKWGGGLLTYIGNWVSGLLDRVRRGFENVVGAIRDKLNAGVATVKRILGSILGVFTQHGNQARDRAKGGYDKVKQAIDSVLQAVRKLFKPFTDWVERQWTQHGQRILTEARKTWNFWKGVVRDALAAAKQIVSDILGGIRDVVRDVTNAILSFIRPKWNAIKAAVGDAVRAIKTTVLPIWNDIKSGISDTVNGVATFLSQKWNAIKTTVQNAVRAIKTTVLPIWNDIKSVISDVVNGIRDFLADAWKRITDIVDSAVSAIQTVIQSGVTVWKTVVTNNLDLIKGIFERIWDGIKGVVEGVIDAIAGLVVAGLRLLRGDVDGALKEIDRTFTDIWNGIKDFVSDTLDGIVDAAKTWAKNVLSAIETGLDNIISAFEDLAHDLIGGSVVPDMLDAIVDAFEGFIDDVLGAVETFVSNVVDYFVTLKDDTIAEATDLADNFFETIDTLASDVVDLVDTFVTDTVDLVVELKDSVVDEVTTLKDDALGLIEDLSSEVLDVVGQMADEFIDEIGRLKDDSIGYFQDLYHEVVGGSIIPDMHSEVVSEAADMATEFVDKVTSMKDDAVDRFTELKDTSIDRLTTLKDTGITRFTTLKDDAVSRATEMKDQVVSQFETMKSDAIDKADALVSGVKDSLSGLKGKVLDTVGNAVDAGKDKFNNFKKDVVGNSIIPDMIDEVLWYMDHFGLGDATAAAIDPARSAVESGAAAMRDTMAGALGDVDGMSASVGAGLLVSGPQPRRAPAPLMPASSVATSRSSRPSRQERRRDSEAIAAAVADTLAGAGIELDADEERLKELGVEGARLVMGELREQDNRSINRGRRS